MLETTVCCVLLSVAHPGCYLGGGLSIYRVGGAGSGVGGGPPGHSYKSCRLGGL